MSNASQDVPEFPLYHSYAEYLRHPQYRAVRASAMIRAGGRCEYCGAPATEVHHLLYPPWGEIEDTADWLQAVCHQCHCLVHGKQK